MTEGPGFLIQMLQRCDQPELRVHGGQHLFEASEWPLITSRQAFNASGVSGREAKAETAVSAAVSRRKGQGLKRCLQARNGVQAKASSWRRRGEGYAQLKSCNPSQIAKT